MASLVLYDQGIYVRFSGEVAGGEVLATNRDLMENPPLSDHAFSIWDYRDVSDLDYSADQIRILAEMDRDYAQLRPGRKIALLVGSSLFYGLGRMYQQYFGDDFWEIRIFRDEDQDQALQWVGIPALS